MRMGLTVMAGLGSRPTPQRPTQRESECPSVDETKADPTRRPHWERARGWGAWWGRESSLRHISPRLAEPSVTTKDLRTQLKRLASYPSNGERTSSTAAPAGNPTDQNNQQHTRPAPAAPRVTPSQQGPCSHPTVPSGSSPSREGSALNLHSSARRGESTPALRTGGESGELCQARGHHAHTRSGP